MTWTLDGTPVETGTTYTYTAPPTVSSETLHTLKACSTIWPTACSDPVSIVLLAESISVEPPSPSVLFADGASISYLYADIGNGPQNASVNPWTATVGQAPAKTGNATATYTAPFATTISFGSNGTVAVTITGCINGASPAICNANSLILVQPVSGQDTVYPNDSNVSETYDNPGDTLSPSDGELARSFSATIYLMWDPAIPFPGQNSCQVAMSFQDGSSLPSTCASIPVPLGSVSWHWSGCAINTLTQQANDTTWARDCGLATPYYPQSSGYPSWTQRVSGANLTQCVPAN